MTTALPAWRDWIEAVCARDPRFQQIEALAGPLVVEPREPGFPALVRIVVGQQLSTRAARAIYQKLLAAQNPLTPDWFLAEPSEALRAFGLSGSKVRTCKTLAEAVQQGELDFDQLAELSDSAVIETLTRFWGVGSWTAEIYLLFVLQRPDVWPMGDLGLRAGYQHLAGHEALSTPEQMHALGETLRPYRSVVAHLLWHYYNHGVRLPKA